MTRLETWGFIVAVLILTGVFSIWLTDVLARWKP